MDSVTKEEAEKMETIYVNEFTAYIHEHTANARLVSIDGHARWLVKDGDVERIVRPVEAKSNE